MVEAGRLGVVVIGRNEGIRLERCLESLQREPPRTVYVDSHSSDGSVNLARALGVEVVELAASAPLTPARGRNAGWRVLEERLPELEFIQFVDGDCELQQGWLEAGVAYLREHADVAVVCGRLRERSRNLNAYHRLADMEWDLPPGEAEYCGGIGYVSSRCLASGRRVRRVAGGRGGARALLADPAPREPGDEARQRDGSSRRCDEPFLRVVGSGDARGKGVCGERVDVQEFAGSLSASRGGCPFSSGASRFPSSPLALAWSTSGLSLALLGLYPVLLARVFAARVRRGDSRADAALYAAACVLAKFAQAMGLAQAIWGRALGRGAEPALLRGSGRLMCAVQAFSRLGVRPISWQVGGLAIGPGPPRGARSRGPPREGCPRLLGCDAIDEKSDETEWSTGSLRRL